MFITFSTTNARKAFSWSNANALVLVLCLFGCVISGCGRTTLRPVDANVADAVLKTALDNWQAGHSIQDLKQQNEPIIVQESDWSDGLALVSYRILKSTPRDANLIVEVELELENTTKASAFIRKREYIVSSHPVKTVFRNLN